jgi:hypothetical protein
MTLLLAPQLAFALCAAVLLGMTVPGFLLYRRFLRDLRTRHPAVWERLGRPTVVYYSSQQARRDLNRWVAEGRFDSLSDPGFASDCRRYRAYARLYGAVLTGLWILFALIVSLKLALA